MRHSLFLLFVLLISCTTEQEKEGIEPYKGPVSMVKDVELLYSDSARVKIKLKAPLQEELENGNRVFNEGVYIEFFNEKGTVGSTIEGDQGKYDKKSNMYTVRGNVVVINKEKDETLRTEELFWKPKTGKITTEKYVEIETDGELLTGNGLTANQDFSYYEITRPKGIFSIENDP
jgi:LPS export ABC transporter protein LptC